jgi:hypothetical protein
LVRQWVARVKRTALKRKPWRRALGTPEQRLAFKQAVLAADDYRCIQCAASPFSTPDLELKRGFERY